jgi:hypothetical protein
MGETKITIYARPDSHLCDEAEARVGDLVGQRTATIEIINIEHDDELHKRYLELIPVIELNGERVSELIQYRGERFEKALEQSLIN